MVGTTGTTSVCSGAGARLSIVGSDGLSGIGAIGTEAGAGAATNAVGRSADTDVSRTAAVVTEAVPAGSSTGAGLSLLACGTRRPPLRSTSAVTSASSMLVPPVASVSLTVSVAVSVAVAVSVSVSVSGVVPLARAAAGTDSGG